MRNKTSRLLTAIGAGVAFIGISGNASGDEPIKYPVKNTPQVKSAEEQKKYSTIYGSQFEDENIIIKDGRTFYRTSDPNVMIEPNIKDYFTKRGIYCKDNVRIVWIYERKYAMGMDGFNYPSGWHWKAYRDVEEKQKQNSNPEQKANSEKDHNSVKSLEKKGCCCD